MPVMDGLEMLRQLRASQALQHIKVVVSSASVAVSDRQTSIDAGGDAFLPKPVQIEELLQILQSQLNLTWQYTDAISPKPEIAPEALIDDISLIPDQIPDVVHLQALLTLVQLGLLKKFIEEAQRIEQMNPDYHPFILKTIQLAKNFQIESLEQLLEKHIS
jgi:DNA-binding response OmpR family regulator